MNTSLVSVIVPVYNVEKYLDRCVKSIINQSYWNLEIILVNDGSTDKSGQICEMFEQIDKRIKVIHKENGGLGYARNTGLDCATGEFVCFVDSDDYVSEKMIETCIERNKKSNAEVICYGMNRVLSNGKIVENPLPKECLYSGKEVINVFLPRVTMPNIHNGGKLNISLNACSIFVKMDLIKKDNWRFVSEREIISEDYYSLLFLYRKVQVVEIIPYRFYYYCTNEQSLTQAYRTDRAIKNKVFYQRSMEAIIELGFPEGIKLGYSNLFINNMFATIKQLVKSHERFWMKKRDLKKIIFDQDFQSALRAVDWSGEGIQRKVIRYCLLLKLVHFSYILFSLKK